MTSEDEMDGDEQYADERRMDDTGGPRNVSVMNADAFQGQLMQVQTEDAGAMAGIARERFEIEAMVAIAMRCGRDEKAAYGRIAKACQRETFAAKAEYRYPRGDGFVSDVSIKGMRPIAQSWGHMRFGWTFVRVDEEGYHIRGYAHDLVSNDMRTQEHSGRWMHQRKQKGGPTRWVKVTDERERREIVGRQGSILERNCLKAIIPFDVIEDAMAQCKVTNRAAAAKELKQNPEQTRRRLIGAFAALDVTIEDLERFIGHPLEKLTAAELEELRSIERSIRENGQPREKYFDDATGAPDAKPAAGDAQTTGAKLDLSSARSARPQDAPGGHAVGGAASETKLADASQQKPGTGPAASTSKPANGQGTLDVDAKTKKDPPPPTAKS